MRIVQILHGTPADQMGGTGLYVEAISAALKAEGHAVAIAAPGAGSDFTSTTGPDGVEVWRIGTPSPRHWRDTWDQSTQTWRDWLSSWRPDVVHIHHLSGAPLKLVADIPARTVLTLHDYAIPCARGQLVTAELARCTGPAPLSCTRCLGPALQSNPLKAGIGRVLSRAPRLYKAVRARTVRTTDTTHPDVTARIAAAAKALAAADVLLSPSIDLADRITAMGHRRPTHTQLPLLRPPPKPAPSSPGPVRFLFASSIIPTKGPDRALRAFAQLEGDARLTIAGHTPDFDGHPGFAAALQAQANTTKDVSWIGHVAPGEVGALMAAHDVLLLPSIWPENSPLVVREATAIGMGVIASVEGGTGELAPHAQRVDTDADLLAAMQAATTAGRVRHPRQAWPTVTDHVQTLLSSAYS
jgi:glycosyltransferase involved in cell wall biosynthesis